MSVPMVSISVFPGFTFPPKKHPDPSLLSITPLVLSLINPLLATVWYFVCLKCVCVC